MTLVTTATFQKSFQSIDVRLAVVNAELVLAFRIVGIEIFHFACRAVTRSRRIRYPRRGGRVPTPRLGVLLRHAGRSEVVNVSFVENCRVNGAVGDVAESLSPFAAAAKADRLQPGERPLAYFPRMLGLGAYSGLEVGADSVVSESTSIVNKRESMYRTGLTYPTTTQKHPWGIKK